MQCNEMQNAMRVYNREKKEQRLVMYRIGRPIKPLQVKPLD
jgi:hypothetical protein